MTPAELRGLAERVEDESGLMGSPRNANGSVPERCQASISWIPDGEAIATIHLPNGEEPSLLIGEGYHPSNPSRALTAACLRARAYLMENANG